MSSILKIIFHKVAIEFHKNGAFLIILTVYFSWLTVQAYYKVLNKQRIS